MSRRATSIIGAHLLHRSEGVRVRSVDVILNLASSDAIPTVIAGDLNSTPTTFPGSQTEAEFGNSIDKIDASSMFRRHPNELPPASDGFTYHSARPASVIDWVLVPKRWQFSDYRVVLSQLSDHRPVVADIVVMPVTMM